MTGIIPIEISVDCFAGGGGVSTGHEHALGYSPHIAINHDAVAIAMHQANHPHSNHLNSNIFKVIPSEACEGRPIGLLWLSPDCKHFSKAKGAKPVEKRIRGLAWVALHWAKLPVWQRPRVIFLENVEEFLTWGPLLGNGRPDPERKGEEFAKFIRALKREGYKRVEWKLVRMCDYGDPTIRRRLLIIARCDDEPILWPEPSHGNPKSEDVKSGRLLPWRTAAEDVIDWSIPCPSIFLSPKEVKQLWSERGIRVQRPLRPKTLARIFKGLVRFVLECADPFIVPVTHAGDLRCHTVHEPVRTQTGAKRGEHALVAPYFAPRYQEKDGHEPRTRGVDLPMATTMPGGNEGVMVAPYVTKFNRGATGHAVDGPLHTVTAHSSATHGGGASPLGMVMPYLIPRYGERVGQGPRSSSVETPLPVVVPTGNGATLIAAALAGCGGRASQSPPRPADAPLATVTAKPNGCVIAAHLSRQFGASVGSDCAEPVGTVTAGGGGKTALVNAFLAQHNYQEPGHDAREPLSTIVGKGCTQAIVECDLQASAGMLNLKGSDRRTAAIDAPVPAVTAQGGHLAEVRAFLTKYYSTRGGHQDVREPLHTVTAKARFGLVTIHGQDYQIVDIGMRMLTPRERFNAHSFPASYQIDVMVPRIVKGETILKRITAEEQGRMVGNSVPVKFVRTVIATNYRPRPAIERKPPRASEELVLEAAE